MNQKVALKYIDFLPDIVKIEWQYMDQKYFVAAKVVDYYIASSDCFVAVVVVAVDDAVIAVVYMPVDH